jgi:hypothetical protein
MSSFTYPVFIWHVVRLHPMICRTQDQYDELARSGHIWSRGEQLCFRPQPTAQPYFAPFDIFRTNMAADARREAEQQDAIKAREEEVRCAVARSGTLLTA